MTTGSTGATGATGTTGTTDGAVARRAERARRRAAATERRAAWAGTRWWAPGAVVAVGTAVVAWLAVEAWTSYEAGGCGNPGAKFECLGETLVATAAAVVLGPLLLWLAYRAAGVRRPLPSVVVAVAVAWVLLAAVELVAQVRVLSGLERSYEPLTGAGVAALLGVAVLGGGLSLQGPHRAVRAVVAAGALGALVVSVFLLDGPADRAGTRLELLRAEVPLLLPGPGWEVASLRVDAAGDLSYDAVPVGFDGYGFEGVPVDVAADVTAFGESCGYERCVDVGDVRVEVPAPGDDSRATGWRVVDGTLVTVGRYDSGDDPALDPVDFLAGMAPATVEEALAREFTDR